MQKNSSDFTIGLHTRLAPMQIAIDVDYAALWRRAQTTISNGRTILALAPEDHFMALAIQGGKNLWWNIKWACDVAALIGSHRTLDWVEMLERAQSQGCRRTVLLATTLAHKYFGATIPDVVAAAEHGISIEPILERIVANWQAELTHPANNQTLWMDRMWLHDGLVRRARYMSRTFYLPAPPDIAWILLPRRLRFAYGPLKIARDIIALPLLRTYRQTLAHVKHLRDAFARSDLVWAVLPVSAEIRRHQKERVDATRALRSNPNSVTAWHRLGNALADLNRYKQAIACYDNALLLGPDQLPVWKKRSAAMEAIGRKVDLWDVTANPNDSKLWGVRAGQLWVLKRFAEAAEASDRAIEIDPHNIAALRVGIQSRQFSCDWRKREDDKRHIGQALKAGHGGIITPFFHRAMIDSEAESLTLAQLWARGLSQEKTVWRGEIYHHNKIRVAYISTDLRDHVVADVIAGCFEQHDKTHFEITAISLGANDKSEMRQRLEAAFDRFIDAHKMRDDQIATILRELEIDIAVDLNANPGAERTGILARRPAPLQVNYLGYPGTKGVAFFDYVIADPTVIPEENRMFYSEQVAWLPHTYMPTDQKRAIAARRPTRSEAGLPETGFVFACHHPAFKITPEVFDVWMHLLRAVDSSVLWLRSNPAAVINLRREARFRGIAPERLVFAPHTPQSADHLARLPLADLFLDTLPYNAHSAACDALWSGLPVLTCLGNTFAGRVCAGLLYAMGLPELVTSSLDKYEQLARMLAQEPLQLACIRAKLLRNRKTEPLFDTARFTRNLESAYTAMWERQRAGLLPGSFTVAT